MIEESNTVLVAAAVITVMIACSYIRSSAWWAWRKQRPSMHMSVTDPRFNEAMIKWRNKRPGRK